MLEYLTLFVSVLSGTDAIMILYQTCLQNLIISNTVLSGNAMDLPRFLKVALHPFNIVPRLIHVRELRMSLDVSRFGCAQSHKGIFIFLRGRCHKLGGGGMSGCFVYSSPYSLSGLHLRMYAV